MITNQFVSITDLRQDATAIISALAVQEKIVMVHGKPKAALIDINEYEKFKSLAKYMKLMENAQFLANNPSLKFLEDEPDLYE